ncbi:MAPEG family protein [Pseudenhygromyxa sp. WMMC2535]|uniref:MAPEG family protein n=1 Tax=Pseudenhygromyxa sp. WMMC2535 TaxID=2712867 RepID=UPI001556A085|nr:MAPEG family protein [Pseudenhygromyxa sp. WMMC2535]NVB38391.1 MAPEG family protein [Pseudenhygromyxa sp. WMMC2535]
MSTPFLCLLVAFVWAWLIRIPVFVAIRRAGEEIDNELPLRQLAKLEGFGARAVAAHQAALQNFAPFAAAVITSQLFEGDPRRASVLAIGFVVAQVLHTLTYLANVDYLRSFVWLVGFLSVVGLFLLAL